MASYVETIEEELAKYGDWYHIGGGLYEDRDTGITSKYDDIVSAKSASQRQPRQQVSNQAKEARKTLKEFGFKAFTGSAKQKNWAEKIRNEKMQELTSDQKEFFATQDLMPAHKASWWIDRRDIEAFQFKYLAEQMIENPDSHDTREYLRQF